MSTNKSDGAKGRSKNKVVNVGSKWWKGTRMIKPQSLQAVGLAVAATLPVVASVSYFVVYERSHAASTTTIETTASETKRKTFEDGTNLLLGVDSIMWTDFRGGQRRASLQGQATLDVAQDEEPFVLATGLGNVTTQDGKFSVTASPTNLDIEVNRGTVSLSTKSGAPLATLKAGQRYRLFAPPPQTARVDGAAERDTGPSEG